MYYLNFLAFARLLAIIQYFAHATPTWPAPTDELEDIVYLNTGYRSRGFAAPVTPCSSGLSSNRIIAAEWLRTAFHDAITGNMYTGVGGLDGSIAFEFSNAENVGIFARASVTAWANFTSDLTSFADVVAAGAYAAIRSCSNITLSMRGGRITATGAGPFGVVPQPQNPLGTFRNQFARMGLGDQQMIQFVACGHAIGGVHGADHPDVTNDDFSTFDSTPAILDNRIAIEYTSGTTKNPLVVGKSVGTKRNSDFVIFSQTDRNATIGILAQNATLFANACQSLFQKMVDFVPSNVQLSDPIIPYEVKPYDIQLTLLDGGSQMEFSGEIRIRTTQRPVTQVQLSYIDRNGVTMQTAIDTIAVGTATGFDDSFAFFSFSTSISSGNSISAFNVLVTYPDSVQVYDNNGSGFQVDDTIIYQAAQSCLDTSGQLTVVAAARNTSSAPSLEVILKIPQASPNPVPSISTATAAMVTKSAVGPYQLYAGTFTLSGSAATSALYGVYAAKDADTRKSPVGLPAICTPLAMSSQTSVSSSASSSAPTSISVSSASISPSSATPILPSTTLGPNLTASPSSSPTPITDRSLMGCYSDSPEHRALSAMWVENDKMSVEQCASACTLYQYFGVEYSRECYCANAVDATSTERPSTECSMHCAGDSTEICGDANRISMYQNLRYTQPNNPHIAGYSYAGCFSEGSNTRALIDQRFGYDNLTVEFCSTLCNNATYFGVEHGSECYCGRTLQDGSVAQSAGDCDMRCAGNITEYCGGNNRLNLYQNKTPAVPLTNPTVADYTHQGCHADSVEARVLNDTWSWSDTMTVEKCALSCAGYTYFGTEYSTQCYCGNEFANPTMVVAEEECSFACSGDATEACGAGNRLSMYKKSG